MSRNSIEFWIYELSFQPNGENLTVLSEAMQELKTAVESSSGVAKLIEALPSASHDQ